MEELKEKRNDDDIFLHGICYIVLCVDSRIKFVGIVDSSGKLLIGKYREEIRKQKENVGQDICNIKSSLFYTSLILPGLKIYKRRVKKVKVKDSFKVVEFDKIKLAISPLSCRLDRYLCVYLEPSASYEEIIPKIKQTV
jgi:hypothetical protein